jgi:beta-galactosidase
LGPRQRGAENRFGKGTVTYEGTILSDELQRKVLERVLNRAQLTTDRNSSPDIRVKHGANRAGKRIHYFFNFSANPQQMIYAYPDGLELLAGRAVSRNSQIALKPWDVAIVEEQAPL